MCGIVGAIRANHNVVDFLTDGLKRLEYRGYDSSGIAVNMDGKINRVPRVARVLLLPVSVERQATTSVRVPLRACPALPEQAVTPAVRATPHDS